MAIAARYLYALEELTCGSCGVVHAIPQGMYENCKREGGFWYCPNGHQRGWREGAEKTKILQLEAELRSEQRRREAALVRANDATAKAVKAERALSRHKTRAKNGVCPCCKRTFQQLARHMANKHPDYNT